MKIGDYVRTKRGEIGKIIDFINEPTDYYFDCYMTTLKNFTDKYIMEDSDIKSSSNIIELLEVGDLVKIEYYSLRYEKRVERLFEVTYKDKEYLNLENSKCDFMLINKEFTKHDKALEPVIKSIVTNEMYSSVEYEV